MAKLMKTESEMRNATREVKHYYISEFFPAHEERCHNDRWMEPAQWRQVEVDEDTYKNTKRSEQRGIKIEEIHVPYDEFISKWEKKFPVALHWAQRNPTLENVENAIFAVKQYGYILDVQCEQLSQLDDISSELKRKANRAEREGLNEILETLQAKLAVVQAEEEEKRREKAARDAEKAELKRLKRIAKLKKELQELENQG